MATGISLGLPGAEAAEASALKRVEAGANWRVAEAAAGDFAGLVTLLGTPDEKAGWAAPVPAPVSASARPDVDPAPAPLGRWVAAVYAWLGFDAAGASNVTSVDAGHPAGADHDVDPDGAPATAREGQVETAAGTAAPARPAPVPMSSVPVPPAPVTEAGARAAAPERQGEAPLAPDPQAEPHPGSADVRPDPGSRPRQWNHREAASAPRSPQSMGDLPTVTVPAQMVIPGERIGSSQAAAGPSPDPPAPSESATHPGARIPDAVVEKTSPGKRFAVRAEPASDAAHAGDVQLRTAAARVPQPDEARQDALMMLKRALSHQPAPPHASTGAHAASSEPERVPVVPALRAVSGEAAPEQPTGSEVPPPATTSAALDRSGDHQSGRRRESGGDLVGDHRQSPPQGRPATGGAFTAANPVQARGLPDATPVGVGRPAQDAAGDPPPSLPQQVVRAVHLQWRQGVGEARLQLKPEHLGQLTVMLRVERGVVSAVLRTETRLALERIEANQQELRTALEQLGLRLDQFVVGVDPDARGRRQSAEPPWIARRPGRTAQEQPVFDLGELASE